MACPEDRAPWNGGAQRLRDVKSLCGRRRRYNASAPEMISISSLVIWA